MENKATYTWSDDPLCISCRSVAPSLEKNRMDDLGGTIFTCYEVAIYGAENNCASFLLQPVSYRPGETIH